MHSHALHADFVSTQAFEGLAALQAQLTPLLSGDLVRLKGIVALKKGQMCVGQWSWLDTALTVTVHEGVPPDQWGVTCIRQAKSH